MPMTPIETKILPNAVYMRLADDRDPQKADYWIEFQVPIGELTLPISSGPGPLAIGLGSAGARLLGVQLEVVYPHG